MCILFYFSVSLLLFVKGFLLNRYIFYEFNKETALFRTFFCIHKNEPNGSWAESNKPLVFMVPVRSRCCRLVHRVKRSSNPPLVTFLEKNINMKKPIDIKMWTWDGWIFCEYFVHKIESLSYKNLELFIFHVILDLHQKQQS